METIYIIDAKILKMPVSELFIAKAKHLPVYYTHPDPAEPVPYEVQGELLRAKRFVTKTGRHVSLGVSKDLQEILEIPFQCFDQMSKQISDSWTERQYLKTRIDNLRRDAEEWDQSWACKLRRIVIDFLEML